MPLHHDRAGGHDDPRLVGFDSIDAPRRIEFAVGPSADDGEPVPGREQGMRQQLGQIDDLLAAAPAG